MRVFIFSFFFFGWISSFFLNNYILGRMYILSFFSSIVTSVLTKQHVLHRWIPEFYPLSCWSFLLSMRSSTQSWYNILTVIKRNMWRYNILSLHIPLWAAAEAEFLFKLNYGSFFLIKKDALIFLQKWMFPLETQINMFHFFFRILVSGKIIMIKFLLILSLMFSDNRSCTPHMKWNEITFE